MAVVASLLQLVTGHSNAVMVSEHQPAKLAAFEGHFRTGPADLSILGIPDADEERIVANLAQLLENAGGGRGLISVCTAGGMGVAAIVERPAS